MALKSLSLKIPALVPALFVAMIGAVSAAIAAPRVEIVGGEVIDLGRSRPGRFARQIAITNSGTDTLRLESINSGCGCLVGEPDRRALGPGDTARLQILVETSGQVVEHWQKALTITTNDPYRPHVDITVRVSFRHDLRLLSAINTVQRAPCEGTCAWMIELENIGDSTVVVNPPFLEEMRGVTVTFDMTTPRMLAPGEKLIVAGRVVVVGGEEFPSAKALVASSSAFDPETYVSWFHAPEK